VSTPTTTDDIAERGASGQGVASVVQAPESHRKFVEKLSGKWRWQETHDVEFSYGGQAISSNGDSGIWDWADAEYRQISVDWPAFKDRMTISDDFQAMSGTNQKKQPVLARRIKGPVSRKSENNQSDDSHAALVILSAFYGHGSAFLDVTDSVRRQLRDGRISILVSDTILGCDPSPQNVKTLKVEFSFHGRSDAITVMEGQRLSLP
jgi:hypothetical protein